MSVSASGRRFKEQQPNSRNFFAQSPNKIPNFQIFLRKNCPKCSFENQFLEYYFLSKIVVTELKVSILAS